jgi:hypothetical protein
LEKRKILHCRELWTRGILKSIILWDITPCRTLSFNRRFGGTYRLHLQGRRNRFSKPASKQVASLLNIFLRPWRWRRYVPPKRRLKLNGLHGAISQKMILFITTAVKTSNPTKSDIVDMPVLLIQWMRLPSSSVNEFIVIYYTNQNLISSPAVLNNYNTISTEWSSWQHREPLI